MSLPSHPASHAPIECVQIGRVSIYLGARSGKYPDGNQVLIKGSDTLAAFDTPLISNEIGPAFDQSELVVMGHVHEDHVAGLHRLPQAEVHVHEEDVAALRTWEGMKSALGVRPEDADELLERLQKEFFYAPRPDALSYVDGATWSLGRSQIRAYHMPGHTAGHTVLVVEPEGVAFIGDIDLTGFGPYYGDPCSSLSDFRRTLALLPEIPASVWVTSHHRGVYTDRERFLKDLAAFIGKLDEREAKLMDWLRERPLSLAQMCERRLLYPVGFQASWVEAAEARTIQQHLDELLAAGQVNLYEDGIYACA